MPIQNRDDAVEVETQIASIFAAPPSGRTNAIRRLFVETLDFNGAFGLAGLAGASAPSTSSGQALPDAAERIAVLEGVQVVYIPLNIESTDRVRKAEVDAAARLIADQLGDDLLLVFTNTSASQLHLILPKFEGARPALRRMVVERDLPRRTAVQQVAGIYWNYRDKHIIRAALDEAFDVEPVTREFFAEYKRIFEGAMGAVGGFGEGEGESKRTFVQTLFNRLMFVYFLSRKGWLRFDGNADYLNALWQDYGKGLGDGNFHRDRLRPLFFSGLNNPNSRDLTEGLRTVIGDVPFLNGGLFEETELDKRNGIAVPDEAIGQVLTGLFDRFNFTVMESTPFDIEVAVDPEMLGKVFEELVTGRHDSGAYYTPRPVVSFMCREALKGYLEGQDTGLASEAIARFVDHHETDGIGVAQARRVAEALAEVTVVDPACGSGAYLLGMMQELIELQVRLFNVTQDAKSLYDLKLEIIQRNLYGVDSDRFAVNIAMLRMWLSLAIDYEGDTPEPLPNLDFKVVWGDSLLGPDPSSGAEVQVALGQDVERVRLLGQRKGEYLRASNGVDKDRLREEIAGLTAAIREENGAEAREGVVDWRVQFAEVFAENRRGFDIAIANPPYVRQENIGTNKAVLSKQYADAATSRSDLYCYFYARALQLLRDGGLQVFVCSNSWLDVGYGAKLQEYLLNNAHVQAIYESAVERQFATADINTVVSVIRKTGAVAVGDTTRFVSLRDEFETALADASARREIVRRRAALRAAGRDGNKHVGDKWGGKYLRAPDIYHTILNNYGNKLVRLGDVATVRFGIKTGANDFFYLTPETIKHWGVEAEYCRPVMTTPQESRRIAVDPSRLPKRLFMCHDDKDALKGTGALAYIQWGESQGYHTRTSVKSRKRWYDLGERDNVYLGMNKLVDTTARTFLASNGAYFTDNFQVMTLGSAANPVRLCVALNSTVFQLMINTEARSNFGQGVLEIQTYETANASIVNPELLTDPAASAFNAADWDVLNPSAARRHIDDAVFDVLGLTQGEREAVYAGVAELVGNRKRRAGSVSGSANPTGAARAKDKPAFRVAPNRGGLAPGVTADNIKDIIFDSEDEDFLEKLNQ